MRPAEADGGPQGEVEPKTQLATSLALALTAVAIFAGLWLLDFAGVDCPQSLEEECGIAIFVLYLDVVPPLALLGLLFAGRDVCRRRFRRHALIAFGLCAALLFWYWRFPPH